jgi:hypothetical protein
MATDVSFLAPGQDGHGLRLAIGHKALRKTWDILALTFSIVDSLINELLICPNSWSVRTLLLILLVPLTSTSLSSFPSSLH